MRLLPSSPVVRRGGPGDGGDGGHCGGNGGGHGHGGGGHGGDGGDGGDGGGDDDDNGGGRRTHDQCSCYPEPLLEVCLKGLLDLELCIL